MQSPARRATLANMQDESRLRSQAALASSSATGAWLRLPRSHSLPPQVRDADLGALKQFSRCRACSPRSSAHAHKGPERLGGGSVLFRLLWTTPRERPDQDLLASASATQRYIGRADPSTTRPDLSRVKSSHASSVPDVAASE